MSALTCHKLNAGIRYRLICRIRKPQIVEFRHAAGGTDYILLPADAFRGFLITPMEHDINVCAPNSKIHPSLSFPWLTRNAEKENVRILREARFAAPLRYGGCIYTFERPVKGEPKQSLADNRGMDLGSESLATLLSSEMILDAIPSLPDGNAPRPRLDGTVAVVLHLHYPELWGEFSTFLKHSKIECLLIVTLTVANAELIARIKEEFPGTLVQVVRNLGRDVRPFMRILQSGLLDDVDLICKVHGKRSIFSGATGARFGHLWRRRAFMDLLGSPSQVQEVFTNFQTRPHLGMMGPATLRLRRGDGVDPGFRQSLPIRKSLATEASFSQQYIEEDFFAGTMFWIRRKALDPLRKLSLQDDIYTQEIEQTGDQFEHALERFFADTVRAQGYHLSDIEPLSLAGPKVTLRSKNGRLLAPHGLFQAPNKAFSSRWVAPLAPSLANASVVLMASCSPDMTIPTHSLRLLSSMKDAGYYTVLCMACQNTDKVPSPELYENVDAIFLRDLGGFDMALWGAALRYGPELWNARKLIFVTDAVTGPHKNADALFSKFEQAEADCSAAFVSLEPNREFSHHLFVLHRAALAHPEVRAFFQGVLSWNKESECKHRYYAKLRVFLAETCGLAVKMLDLDVDEIQPFRLVLDALPVSLENYEGTKDANDIEPYDDICAKDRGLFANFGVIKEGSLKRKN